MTVSLPECPWEPGQADIRGKKVMVGRNDLQKMLLYDVRTSPDKQKCALAGIAVSACTPMITKKCPYSRLQALLGRAFLEKPAHHPLAWGSIELLKN